MSERKFTHDDAQRILARAAALEEEGFSIPEIEHIGRDVGIDAARVQQAIAEKDRVIPPAPLVLGAPPRVHFESTVPRALSDVEIERALSEVRRWTGERGRVEKRGTTTTWIGWGLGRTTLTIAVYERSTAVHISSRFSHLIGGLYGGVGGGAGGGIGGPLFAGVLVATGSLLFAVLALLLSFGSAIVLARGIYKSIVFGRIRDLLRVLDRITEASV